MTTFASPRRARDGRHGLSGCGLLTTKGKGQPVKSTQLEKISNVNLEIKSKSIKVKVRVPWTALWTWDLRRTRMLHKNTSKPTKLQVQKANETAPQGCHKTIPKCWCREQHVSPVNDFFFFSLSFIAMLTSPTTLGNGSQG